MSSPTAEDGRPARRRRLSAILQADLAGYVRLMEGAEDRTVSRLKSVRAEVWRPAVEAAGGRIVNIVADSVLAEFSSAVAAVAAAIDLQERMARFNDALDEEQRLMFRIGLHLGEVIVDETETIFGDAVNVAARIQLVAEPGGIAVSRRNSRRHAFAGRLRLRRWRQASRQERQPFSPNLSCPHARERVRSPDPRGKPDPESGRHAPGAGAVGNHRGRDGAACRRRISGLYGKSDDVGQHGGAQPVGRAARTGAGRAAQGRRLGGGEAPAGGASAPEGRNGSRGQAAGRSASSRMRDKRDRKPNASWRN